MSELLCGNHSSHHDNRNGREPCSPPKWHEILSGGRGVELLAQVVCTAEQQQEHYGLTVLTRGHACLFDFS